MTGTFRTAAVRVTLTAGLALALACACSGVPDIHYADGGDGTSSSGGSSGTPEPPKPPDWACPDKPPPAGQGICCGNRLCLKCTASDCTKCEQEGCAGTLSAACCRKNPAQFMCKAWDGC